MRVYSKYRNKYGVYRVYEVFGDLLSCRQDPCSVINKYRQKERGEEDSDPGLQCGDCLAPNTRDTQAHCLSCPAWKHERTGLDLEDIEDLVTYFRRVLEGRSKKGGQKE